MGTARVEVLPVVGQLLCLHRPQWLPGASSIRNACMCLSKWKKICLPGKPLTHVETTISFSKIGFHFMTDHAVSCGASIFKSTNKSALFSPVLIPLWGAFMKTQTDLLPRNILSITVKRTYIVFPETEKRKHSKWETLNLIMLGMAFKRPELWGGLVCGNNKIGFIKKKKNKTYPFTNHLTEISLAYSFVSRRIVCRAHSQRSYC